ncbi:LuxR C-terminal-related transcriptional regulator [Streptomyces sp. NPDC053542]|uniref:helix-turn-helix transcriptional regulator n=1 Tax=Streptomyces sp. NPDC053542 TaxID=3365710 RepID=UPI0037D4DC6C
MVKAGGKARTQSTDLALALYQELRSRGASSFDAVVSDMALGPEERERCRNELLDLGLIVHTGTAHDNQLALASGKRAESDTDAVAVIDPEIALLRLLEKERLRLREHLHQADEAYSTLETLAGSFLRAGSLVGSEVEVEVLTDYRRIQQVLEDITDVIQHDLASMHPSALQREVPERPLSRDRRQIANGVRVRTIFNQRFASVPDMAEHFRQKVELGVELRLSPVVPMNMIIADHQFAVLPVDPEDSSAGAILARGPALVRSYLALYEHCWHTAVPFGEQLAPERGGDGLSEQQRAALRMLASGMKDEKIARSLGVSLRTVSRLLSELMQELGASSRFEAGVRATRLGWLD